VARETAQPNLAHPRGIINLIYLVASVVIIFGLSFVLGHSMLGGSLKGDSAMHVGYATWLDRYFPSIPHWFPLQGGGTSLLHGYPILGHLLVVSIHRLAGISILQAFRLISFLGFPLTALGIYFLARSVLKRQTPALIAAAFYLLAPVTWTWMYDWGFFSQQVAMIFLPLALISMDRALKASLKRPRTGARRLWVASLVGFSILAIASHMMVASALAAGVSLYVVFAAVLAPKGSRAALLQEGTKILVALGLTVSLAAAAYLVPFYSYSKYADRDGLNNLPPSAFHRLPVPEFLGLKEIDPSQILTRMQFPLPITLLALLGGIMALRHYRIRQGPLKDMAPWTVVAVAAAVFALSPGLVVFLQGLSPLIVQFLNFRSLLVLAMVIVPIISASGAWGLANTIVLSWLSRPLAKLGLLRAARGETLARRFFVSMGSLALAWAGVVPIPGLAGQQPWLRDYGPGSEGLDLRDIWNVREDDPCHGAGGTYDGAPLCQVYIARKQINITEFGLLCANASSDGFNVPDLCEDQDPTELEVGYFLNQCSIASSLEEDWAPCNALVKHMLNQLLASSWPPISIEDADPGTDKHRLLEAILPQEDMLRIDLSPHLGRLAQDLTVYTNTTQVPSYTNQISLIHLMWGLQIGAFYSESAGTPQGVSDLAKWLGINYAILDPTWDSDSNFAPETWETIHQSSELEVLRHREHIPLASALTRPTVLVISSPGRGVYTGLFRLANEGLAPYEEFVLVEGDREVDAYSLEELGRFDLLVLHGYDYGSSEAAWKLLGDYVRNGGSLYVDTGWQYVVPEWEFEETPDVLPVGKLEWTSFGTETRLTLAPSEITEEIDSNQFDPLIWEQDPWSVSGASAESIRDWAQLVLSAQGNPLVVAGQFGQGRVVWSGMNFLSHLQAYDNEEEAGLLRNLLRWLVKGKEGDELQPPIIVRENPDRILFSIQSAPDQTTWLYWREAYYSDWRAELEDIDGGSQIPVYRAGPGFMLMPIDPGYGDVVVDLAWEPSPVEKVAYAASLVGAWLFLGLILDGSLLAGNGLTWLKIAILTRIPRPFLGEGSNKEWAERKHRELTEGELAPGPRTYQPSEAIPWMRPEAEIVPEPSGPANSNGQDPEVPETIEEHEKLLESWLAETGHSEDAWAERLLSKRPTSRET